MLASRLYWTAYLAWQLPGQAAFPFASKERIRRAQSRRVRRMVEHAWRTVPYYQDTMRRLGLTAADFQGAEDLARLPLLEPRQLQRDPEHFLSTKRPRDSYLPLMTSGSTCQPRTIFYDAPALFQNAAHSDRDRAVLRAALGRWAGYREAVIDSPSNATVRLVQRFVAGRAWFPRGLGIQRQYFALIDPPERNARLLAEFRPDLLQSYGSYLDMLFPYLARHGLRIDGLKAVVYTSDRLSDNVRRLIEERFGLPVFSIYGAVETFKVAFQCRYGAGLHLNSDLYPVRIIDAHGREVPPGETGEVVVSNLVNRGTVLLNYRLGDVASLLPDDCPCGRKLPLLSFPTGRTDELIELPSGEVIHPRIFKEILNTETELWQYQVRQTAPSRFQVLLVAGPGAGREAIRRRLDEKLASAFAKPITTELLFVEQLERTSGGKIPAIMAWRGEP